MRPTSNTKNPKVETKSVLSAKGGHYIHKLVELISYSSHLRAKLRNQRKQYKITPIWESR